MRQCVEQMPRGDYRVQDKKVTPPPRARIDESMEALIHHFKLFTEGFRVPAGETYVAIESPRGEIGCYLVADGTGKPSRLHIRGPSFYNLQSMDPMIEDRDGRRRGGDHLERRPDPGRGRPVSHAVHAKRTSRRRTRSSRGTRSPKSAILPLLHLAQDQDGWVTPGGDAGDRGARRRRRPPQVLGTCSFYTMFKRDRCGTLVVSVCTNVTCLVLGGPELLEHLERALRGRRRRRPSRRSSASRRATTRRCCR